MIVSRILGTVTLIAAGMSHIGCAKQQNQPAPVQASSVQTPTVTVTTVVSQELNRQMRLPGELQAYQDVMLYPKIPGFVEAITVDRGSTVRRGQLLVRLRAAELDTQRLEADAKVRAAESQRVEAASRVSAIRAQRLEAQAKLASDEALLQRMKAASATPGAVAGNDLEVAGRTVEASRARIQLWDENEKAAQSQAKTIEENVRVLREAARSSRNIEDYLRISAPFDGVITERNVHPGSLASPTGGSTSLPMLRLQQVSRLRLIVSVPEANVGGITRGSKVSFAVSAFPGETFTGVVARFGGSLDPKTRTMPVELDVTNPGRRLAPGMAPEVIWPVSRAGQSLFVPPSAVATTTERMFVIRVRDGVTEWVDVKRGASINDKGVDLVEIFGGVSAGDQISLRGTDELRAGTRVNVKAAGKP